MYTDERKEYLVITSANYFGKKFSESEVKVFNEDKSVDQFLDDAQCFTLSVSFNKSFVKLDTKLPSGAGDHTLLVFFKLRPEVITKENLHTNIFVSSVIDSPLSTLYHTVQKIYAPALFKGENQDQYVDPKLQELIGQLQINLRTALSKESPNALGEGDKGKQQAAVILTLEDEVEYWISVKHSSRTNDRAKANAFLEILQPLSAEFSSMESMSSLDETLEGAHNSLDDLWKLDEYRYPQNRMELLMDIIGNTVLRYEQKKLKDVSLWDGPYNDVEENLSQAVKECEKWIKTSESLTSLYWPNHSLHPWSGKPYIPNHMRNFSIRLHEILNLRRIHRELSRLLSRKEQEELRTGQAFQPFTGLNPLQVNPYTEPLWQSATQQFERSLLPTEERIAVKLKTQLRNVSANSLQLLQEFKRYQELIQRENVCRALVAERENLLSLMLDYVQDVANKFNKGQTETLQTQYSNNLVMPLLVASIYWTRQLSSKIADIGETSSKILHDLSGNQDLQKAIKSLQHDLHEYRSSQLEAWVQETRAAISRKTLTLKTDEPVVYFEHGRLMRVNYNPALVNLVREVHQLTLLGHSIPVAIQESASLAQKFMKQAKALEQAVEISPLQDNLLLKKWGIELCIYVYQVANFHNTIGDRMILSQRPMMLAAALELSRLVQEQSGVTWNDLAAVDAYIARLQTLVDRLGQENSRLGNYHLLVTAKVSTLMNTNLLRQQQQWKEALKDIRNIMSTVEQEVQHGEKSAVEATARAVTPTESAVASTATQQFSNMKSWRTHWDYQLYKALEHQYQLGLQSLHQHLQEINIELVYRQHKLQFKPPIEDLRMKYYSQLKRFISIPISFRGVSDSTEPSIFPVMIDRNAHRFARVFVKAEEIFGQLENLRQRWLPWVALGSARLDDLALQNLKTWEDWDSNFRTSKNLGQQIAKLPSADEKLECFTVSLAPVRAEIELHNGRYWDTLVSSLQASILQDVASINKFTNEASEKLVRQPTSVDEIREAKAEHARVAEMAPKMLLVLEEAERKNKTLAVWTKERMDQVGRIGNSWDNFRTLLDNHQLLLDQQVEGIKSNLSSQATNFNEELENFGLRWEQLKPRETSLQDGGPQLLMRSIEFLREKRQEWNELLVKRDKLIEECTLFNLEIPAYEVCEKIEADLKHHERLWSLYEDFRKSLDEMSSEEWIIFRNKSYKFDEFLSHWEEKLKSSEETTSLTVRLLQELESYKEMQSNMKLVRGELFSEKHWAEMFNLLDMPNKAIETLTLGDFLAVREKITSNATALQDLNSRASSEIVIRQALNELDIWEVEARFQLVTHQDSMGKRIQIIKDFQEILNKVGDNQSLLQSIKNSPNYQSFSDRADIWENRLADLDSHIRNLNQIQRRWIYLEPIFGGGKVAVDNSRFQRLDRDFRYVMEDIERDNKVVALTRISNLHQTLATLLDQLGRCQKSLNEFLEEKRSNFPRFYFVGDEDLLEILGQSQKQHVIQAHLKKLFAGINNVIFDHSDDVEAGKIISICSLEGEVVPLSKPIDVKVSVEIWLDELMKEMRKTLRQLLASCLSAGNASSSPDPTMYPSQVLSLAQSIQFTAQCENAISKGTLPVFLKSLKGKLESYANMNLMSRGAKDTDSTVLQLKLKTLLIDTIYHVRIVEDLTNERCLNTNDWAWQRQIRFYSQKNGETVVKMVDAEFDYTFEYQGNAPKLVQTPLTDKCFLTLTQGMYMGLGGNPYGPAGTGKTESVKALGGLLGRQVLVFNCDEGIDVVSMARIFVGLAKCGSWGCFDEFNRLEEATLSAISMQIHQIQTAIKSKLPSVNLLGQEISLDPNAGIFVTLNPAGKGYGGRQKLPDNLKQLFRPVVMSQPDNELIAEVILYCEGFHNARKIGAKLVEIFDVASHLLTNQLHYDWGLRALKTVLKGCGSILAAWHQAHGETGSLNETVESELAVQALRLNTLSKLTSGDSVNLDSLVKDVFPNVDFNSSGHERLIATLKESFVALNLQYSARQERKCVELYEQLQQRMGVVVVGPSGCGKSTIIRLLRHALGQMGTVVHQHTMNPKAMPRTQLLGHIDLDTRQWTDGVLTISAQRVYSEPPNIHSWILCDGDIDPEWVESLNSVLDDNRLLTLPSGWRIQFGPNVNFLFETHELTYASPATISRMGVIFLSEDDIDVKNIVTAWLLGQPENTSSTLSQVTEDYFYKAIQFVTTKSEMVIPISRVALVTVGLSQLEGVRSTAHFVVALIRGLGGNLAPISQEIFAKTVFEWYGEYPPDPSHIVNCYYNAARNRLETYKLVISPQLESLPLQMMTEENLPLILTANVQRILDVVGVWLRSEQSQPFVLVGPPGCGKGKILYESFKRLRGVEVAVIHCNAQITPEYVLQKLSQVCMVMSSNTGRVYRPKNCDRLILHFKDIHLARPDRWGTSMIISFLQQVITYKGFFDSDLEWVGLEKVLIVGSMTTDSTQCIISPRFSSIVHICAIGSPDVEELKLIYNVYMKQVLAHIVPKHPVWSSASKISVLVNSMVQIFQEVQNYFTPVQSSHYIFTSRDLTRWCLGLLRYNMDSTDANPNPVLKAFVYEGYRIFRDKLVNETDKTKFDEIVTGVLESDWNKASVIKEISGKYYVTDQTQTIASSPQGRPLTEMRADDWTVVVKKGIQMFGREGQSLDLLIFPELLLEVACVDRVLSVPRGSLLLAGRSGVGRKSSVRIVSAMHSAKLLSLKMGRNYKMANFKNDLKTAMQIAGIDGEQVIFMLEDHHVVDTSNGYLEMINSLLSGGEVPGLYHHDELESVASQLKNQAGHEDFQGSLLRYFAQRVLQNLHIVLVLDFMDPQFPTICASNPAIYKQCSVIWLPRWSRETLLSIPRMLFSRLEQHSPKSSPSKAPGSKLSNQKVLVESFLKIHEQAKDETRTPRRYMSFVRTALHIYNSTNTRILKRKAGLQAGVSKLTEAREVVASLKANAAEQEVKLAEKQAAANSALEMITATMRSANTHKVEMEALKEHTEKENRLLISRKKDIEEELSEIEPMVNEARTAIGNIKSESLSEIRSLRAPPDVIRDILEGVLRLMGIHDTSWNSMKTFLAKRGVKEEIRSFDAHRIDPESRASVEKLLQERGESFDPKIAKRASVAAAPLAAWVTANVKFSRVLEKIQPLETEQNKLSQNLEKAELKIGQLSAGLTDVDKAVAELKDQLSRYTKDAAELQIHLSKAQETISAAEGLVSKLDEEYQRWQDQLTQISTDLEQLPLYAVLAAAFMTYLSPEPEDIRNQRLDDWQQQMGTSGFSLTQFLGSDRQQIQWQSEGLSSDQLSAQNAIVVLQIASLDAGTCLRPLLIDPLHTASTWLKNHLSSKNVEIISQHSNHFPTALEHAIRFGKVLIVQEVDNVDPLLLPILRGDYIDQGSRRVVQVGEKLLDLNSDFQLFLITRCTSPDIPPDAAATITAVNFTTTLTGLAGQLLACALRVERPELETRRNELLRKQEDLTVQLHELQDNLLQQLVQAQGDILQNKELLTSLNETKANSAAISKALAESSGVQAQLASECDTYRPLAQFASSLYFATTDLSKMNSIYQLSVSAFSRLFQKALGVPEGGELSEERSAQLQQRLLLITYQYMSRSIFKADRLTFALHIAHAMRPQYFQPDEWEALTDQIVMELKMEKANLDDNILSFLGEDRAFEVFLLQNAVPNLFSELRLHDISLWRSFMSAGDCEKIVPKHLENKLTLMQRILIVKTLRPDRLHSALTQFSLTALGLRDLSPPPLRLAQLLQELLPSEPVLLITSPGADPSEELSALAQTTMGAGRYHEVAMGQGQAAVASDLLLRAARDGHWLSIKNLHLATNWLSSLDEQLQSLQSNMHPDFRLWLTTEPHPRFSNILAQSCLKVTYEAPPGVKRNLQRTYVAWGQNTISQAGTLGSRALFALAWLHAVVQERRTFIPQGWAKFYEFSDGDLRAAVSILDRVVNKTGKRSGQWDYIHGLLLNAIYGGRVENTCDLRVLGSYLRQFFNNSVLTEGNGTICPGLRVPSEPNYNDHISEIQKLPELDQPSFFGLPDNIGRSWQRAASTAVIDQLKVLSRSVETKQQFNHEMWQRNLSPILNLWKKLNQGSNIIQAQPERNTPTGEKPLEKFVSAEFNAAVLLVRNIHQSLASVSKVIRGKIVPSSELLELADYLMKQQTPNAWQQQWDGPTNSLRYVRGLMSRAIALQRWSEKVLQRNAWGDPLDLADLLHPERFLSALKQHTAREIKVPMDTLHLQSSWTRSSVTMGNNLKVVLTGIQLEGALFDGQRLSKCSSDSPPTTNAPPVTIAWTTQSIPESDSSLQLPLYTSAERSTLLAYLQVPCDGDLRGWIQTGAAFFFRG